ncbi:hypothetical protein C5748_16205 [Phyllobacterium phragmitis]|uniref:Uncharacterized protein n=1 Tax=Phyllobacterium phragmitis TaxID=2670329 RepID=A0A2S9IP87_9HYPH|nr:hypothetical protein [Phyllobacterium phragmitis]PRD42338.1 hypothetical protein C5748_16205 [Phyllobacterium phragmitis]
MSATFGQPGCITPASFQDLHIAMKIEGLLLLQEMGLTRKQMREASGMSEDKIRDCLNTIFSPFKIDGMRPNDAASEAAQ